MKINDVLQASECNIVYNEVNEYVTQTLKEYNDRIENNGINEASKDIFDFVWGNIQLSSFEICILDSPLLQRLRYIKQLGLANLVYCNADYSRFSHTLGVVEVAGRMAKIISEKLKDNNNFKISVVNIIRLAAIFHDVGHMFLSHVSEIYFSHNQKFPRYNEVNDALVYFNKMTLADASMHELFSVMIVNSKEVFRLIKISVMNMENMGAIRNEDIEQIIEYISALIVGIPVNKKMLPYHTIINGTIDADKLDYLSRDSGCTKVPIAVDIARLIQKIDVVDASEDFIEKPTVWNEYGNPNYPIKIMALKYSAQRVFWQLSMARTVMYESVYYHQKVLTAESMFRRILEKICPLMDNHQRLFTNLLKITDDTFNEYFTTVFFPNKNELKEIKEVNLLIKNIRLRDLYKRVVSISQDKIKGENVIVDDFLTNIVEDSSSDESSDFINKIQIEYKNIRSILSMPGLVLTPNFLFIKSKAHNDNPQDNLGTPIEYGNGDYKMSTEVFKDDPWMRGKESKLDQYFLVTDQNDRDLVYFAFEKILYDSYKLILSREASLCAKISYENLAKIKNELFEKGFYDSDLILMEDLMFNSNGILSGTRKTLFDSIIYKFQSYSGVKQTKITEIRLRTFLKQFLWLTYTKSDIELIIDGILRLLNNTIFIEREYFVQSIINLLDRIRKYKYKKNYIVKLGGMFDSANHLSYYFNDVKEKDGFEFVENVNTALGSIKKNDGLILFDDGAYSGFQVVSIFQEMMGVAKENRTTREHHVDELGEDDKKKLKNTNIVLAYLCFNHNSEKFILDKLKEIGIINVKIIYVNNLCSKVFDNEKLFINNKQCDLVKACLATIGKQIMESIKKDPKGQYKENWDEDRIKNASLGYNDAQQMVIFDSNVPTYTITAFWQNGYLGKNKWSGLFQRTDK